MRIAVLAALGLALAACGESAGDTAGGLQETPVSTARDATETTETTVTTTADGGGAPADTGAAEPGRGCADIVAAEVTAEGPGRFTFRVTVASADTGWEKYADAWEVVGPDGAVLGTRILAHPHVDEQPFTRSLAGVEIPSDVDTVEIRARDSVEGYCGATFRVGVPE